jgi:hypothetical protein
MRIREEMRRRKSHVVRQIKEQFSIGKKELA